MVDWNEKYLQKDTPWDRGEPSPSLLEWISRREPCSVIVPGCGRGHEVVSLAKNGFDVTALDLAPQALAQLRETLESQNLKAELVKANVLHWNPLRPAQAIYEQTCLCALDPSHWKAYGVQLFQWLQPKGSLLASFMQTQREGGPPFHCSLESMQELFPETRWTWPQSHQRLEHPRGDIFEITVELIRQ